jgi:hypothetical protein
MNLLPENILPTVTSLLFANQWRHIQPGTLTVEGPDEFTPVFPVVVFYSAEFNEWVRVALDEIQAVSYPGPAPTKEK